MSCYVMTDVDVWGNSRDRAMLTCRPHLPEEIPLQVAVWSQCAETQLHPLGRSVDG